MSDSPWNEKNNTFTWLSSLYNPFKLKVAAIFLKNCQGEIKKSHKEIMKCSFLENFEAFGLQLCY